MLGSIEVANVAGGVDFGVDVCFTVLGAVNVDLAGVTWKGWRKVEGLKLVSLHDSVVSSPGVPE